MTTIAERNTNWPTIDLDKFGVHPANLPSTNQAAIANVIARVKSAALPGVHLKINRPGTVKVCKGDSGDYLTRYAAILLPSNTTFEIGGSTTLQLTKSDGGQNEKAYLLRNDDPVNGNVNICIRGGQIDHNWQSGQATANIDVIVVDGQGFFGQPLWIENVTGFYLGDVEFVNPARWCSSYTKLYRAHFERIFFNDVWRDGLHFCGASGHVTIRDIHKAKTGDNTIAITTRQNQSKGQVGGYFEGQFNDASGNLIAGNIENYYIENVNFDGCQGPIAIFGDSGESIKNITIRNLTGTTNSASPYVIATKNYPLVGSSPSIDGLYIDGVDVATRASGQSADDSAVFLEQQHGTKNVTIKNVKATNGSAINFNGDDFENIVLDNIWCDRSTVQSLIKGNNRFTFTAKTIQAGRISAKYVDSEAFAIDLSNASSTWEDFHIDQFDYVNDGGNGRGINVNFLQRMSIGKYSHRVAQYSSGTQSVVFQNGRFNVGYLEVDNAYNLTGGNVVLNTDRIRVREDAGNVILRVANATVHCGKEQIEAFTVNASDVDGEAATTAVAKTIYLPRCAIITGVAIRAKTAFAGTGITNATVDVRRVTPGSVIGSAENVFAVPAVTVATNVQSIANVQAYINAATALQLRVNTTGANCNALTAGKAEVFIQYKIMATAS